MRKLRMLVTCAAILLLAAACSEQESAQPIVTTEEDELAYELFRQNRCISCHATDLSGTMGDSSNLLEVGSRLTQQEIAEVITNGRNLMPAQKNRLNEGEIDTISTWLAKQK